MKYILTNLNRLAIAGILFAGCATSNAHKVPEINVEHLPRVGLKALKPRELKLNVKNSREAVEKAGNAAAVEATVKSALAHAFTESDIEVKNAASNEMLVDIADYDKATKEDGECVKLIGHLQLKTGTFVKADSFTCQSKTGIAGIQLKGDINRAYEGAIRGLLKAIDKKLNELAK